jgi:S-adenosylmethionine-diacylglycerol 3-amino-3-carboxypropyl transferase
VESEAARHASFDRIRYAQCWEDADVLVKGLAPRKGDVCVSIASAGDNSLALLAFSPARVVAIDLSAAQLACVELRKAAYRELSHSEVLELIGSRSSRRRAELYRRCSPLLSSENKSFWEAQSAEIERGIGGAGKFERYFQRFRDWALALVHGRRTVERLLEPRGRAEREAFYEEVWNNRRWRAMFALFFSRRVMGWLGRDPSFFRYVEGSVAERILARTRHALVELEPARNPYLHWILTGTHGDALPFALRAENFDAIRSNLDRLEVRAAPLERFLEELGPRSVDRYNLSDIFEYMSAENYRALLERLAWAGRPGARLAYWNMLAPRRRPDSLAPSLVERRDVSTPLFAQDKAFFYSDFVVEEVR